MKRLFTFVAVAASLGCTLGKQEAPGLTGPSEYGLSLEVTADRDLMNQDGQSQSRIDIIARGPNGQPQPNVRIRAGIWQGGFNVDDFGSLSQRDLVTGATGQTSVTYTAPAPVSGGGFVPIEIRLTPVGSNYGNTITRNIEILLTPQGVSGRPNGSPTANFFFSPTAPRAGDDVRFDASASSDPDGQIVSYQWEFGDGRTGSGRDVTHSYELAATYNVTLTVTDNQGKRASTAPIPITVGTSANPTANFSFSPSPQISGRDVHFNGGLSTSPDGRTIVRYQWDFGDAAGPERFAEGVTVSHIFGAAGSYRVVLTVTDDTGRKGTTSQTVNIIPPTEHP